MKKTNRVGMLDQFRLISALLIVAIHTSPLISYSASADFILTCIIGRVAVPFFIMVTGYFMYSHIKNGDKQYLVSFCKKIAVIYLISIILYLPLNMYAGYFNNPIVFDQVVKDILVNGTFYHLWYLPALLLGVPLVAIIMVRIKLLPMLIIASFFYLVGLLGDSYYGLIENINILEGIYEAIFNIADYTRNGLFYVPIFLVIGALISRQKLQLSLFKSSIGLFLSTVFLLAEGLLLDSFSLQRHDSMYVMLVPCMYFLFLVLQQVPGRSNKELRSLSLIIYIIHPWMIVIVRGVAKLIEQQAILVTNSVIHYAAVSILSFIAALLLLFVWKRLQKQVPASDSRAWIEVDLDALHHNVLSLQGILPNQSKLMAVVKANAYGHGDIPVAKALNRAGIDVFAVATVAEGVNLRTHGVKGEILILGYTNPRDIPCLNQYRLTQTVVDVTHAETLNASGYKIKVHIKIDTGMHRLGVCATDIEAIQHIYNCENLIVKGVFSHLSDSDSLSSNDVSYTNKQITCFFDTLKDLRSKGCSVGKVHIQGSYGILNYPELPCDYARAGIAIYGVLSTNDKTRAEVALKPVLALKARIASIRNIDAGESIGYARQYTASSNMKIATVTIGYADGIPRNLAEGNGYVLVHEQKAPIIGRICMDQFTIDVTHINEVKANDIVTLIGIDGGMQIQCEDVAAKCGTISNEILSRLGERLGKIYKHA
ncbi:serine racemase VanT catalytic subunit [Radiobacillus sp. PE A8.2]|uniref:serine racemase VanT catalytic subunit n=1 Tax=Radiobacillus sp. PE A8.2 TaxID=3380349 RepID=UPI00389096E4